MFDNASHQFSRNILLASLAMKVAGRASARSSDRDKTLSIALSVIANPACADADGLLFDPAVSRTYNKKNNKKWSMSMFKQTTLAVAVFSALTASAVQATEGGNSSYPVGVENFTCCALPPPGKYGLVYAQHYTTDKVVDNKGNDVTPTDDFKVTGNAIVPRFVWVLPDPVGDASLALHAIIPLVNLDVTVVPGVVEQSKQGLGDMTLGAALGWHHSANLHTLAGLDVIAPTGAYSKGDTANIGRNHWAVQGVYGISWINPEGLNADLKSMWTYNMENSATSYKDGQELIFDYALGWGVGNGLVLGVGGYYYNQITDDTRNGDTVADNRGKALAIGPSVRYDSGKGWFATLKYQSESSVRNRAEGQALWLKAVYPF
jgi:hypothetical protein